MLFSRKSQSTPPGGVAAPLSLEDALLACHRIFEIELREGTRHPRVREAVEALGHAACRQQVPPERMLIEFKGMLAGHPALQDYAILEKAAVTEQLVTWSINAYFEAASDDAPAHR